MPRRETLWKVNDQTARLAELVSDDGDLKEAPLRRDVRSLGRLLGEVLKEQAGNYFFIKRIDDLIWRLSASSLQVEISKELRQSQAEYDKQIYPGPRRERLREI